MRKYRSLMDLGDVFDDMAHGLSYLSPLRTSYSFRGQIVDPEKFDIVPRPSYYDDKIKRSEEEIEALDRQHESEEKYYQERRKRLVEQKEYLLREKQQKAIDKV